MKAEELRKREKFKRKFNSYYASKEEIKPREPSEDTKNKMEINQFIFELCKRETDESTIVRAVKLAFYQPEYDKYKPYYQQWVHHELEKRAKVQEREDEER